MNHRYVGQVVKLILLVALLFFVLLLVWAFESRSMPALKIWHTTTLQSEFHSADVTVGYGLADYLDQEDRLFDELEAKIVLQVKPTKQLSYERYIKAGVQNPAWPSRNWNRSYEMVPEEIKGGALLLHGLSDSPYSLRRLAEILYQRGFYVLALRLPGHGTIPAALTEVRWEDWRAASRIGAKQVRQRIGSELPFFMAGFSNGGALAVTYALDAMISEELPEPEQLLLFSPEIGISPFARIANSQKLLSFIPYFAKFKWLSIQPEYDPFKYNSFPKNAAQEAWELTHFLDKQLTAAGAAGRLKNFPGVLTFLSWQDSTVHTSQTINRLYSYLDNDDSELVIFDVNRFDSLVPFIPAANVSALLKLKADANLPYQLTVITNVSGSSQDMTEKTKAPHTAKIDTRPLDLRWPQDVYSLSHVAIPFPPDDPVYGTGQASGSDYRGLPLGAMSPRGETRLLIAPVAQLMRLRHNPFFSYIEDRVEEEISESLYVDK
ncbi:MAG: alpha/beta fold hydrolase [Halioglobus sp.]|jgi:alpha-beta hydrolase superfamily lysophospholipase|nr:alpha/beta fold hydrolase [Halioglobus sp.]